jgi:iron uptake system component EfeO
MTRPGPDEMRGRFHFGAAVVVALAGCGSGDKSDGQFRSEIVASMHQLLLIDIQGLNKAALDLQTAAPSKTSGGWDPSDPSDQAAILAMKEAWDRTRYYWELAESTLGDSFPALDLSMDSRYEDLLVAYGGGDSDLFDGAGATGMHAIERILYSPGSSEVAAYEMSLPGYLPAAWPADAQQAAVFKTGLCQKLVDDSKALLDQWGTKAIDLPTVFRGLTGLMDAQFEKVGLAVSHKEESRYSQKTMLDLRWNLQGTKDIYGLFMPWLGTKAFGTMLNNSVRRAFDGIEQTYSHVLGDAIPPPPSTWLDPPTVDDQQTPFGQLYEAVRLGVDPSRPDSAVDALNHVARALGLPEFTQQN